MEVRGEGPDAVGARRWTAVTAPTHPGPRQQPLFWSALPWVLPGGFGFEHGIEGDEHVAHEGGEGELGWLALGKELGVAGFQRALVGLEAGDGGHVEGAADLAAAAP